MKILVIGDVVSSAGCEFLRKKLSSFKKENGIDFCIANGENSAVGNGITPDSAQYLFDCGVDFITTGNHIFRRKEIYDFLDSRSDIIRPANFWKNAPGKGTAVVDLGSTQIRIINLSGSAYMDRCDNPFTAVDEILKNNECKITLVDFHAEATAEKGALAYYLDGRVSAVFGTHTHILTADARILPKGTGFITDTGMTGPVNSVLGIKPESSINLFRTGMPSRFEAAEGECMMNGCIFDIDKKTGLCLKADAVNIR